MTSRPDHPGNPTPPPLNEEHMLEWVEGRLSRIEEANRAAATRAGVGERVKQMQANRRALMGVSDEKAPPELMDRVLAALEREALLGLSNGEAVSEHPPINFTTHTVTVSRSRRLERWAPGLALAAGLLLLVGGAAYWGSVLIKPSPLGPLATNDTPEVLPQDTSETMTALRHSAPEGEEAMSTLAAPHDPSTPVLAQADEEMTDKRILRLAREGRLVIRVYSKDPRRLAQIEAMGSLDAGRTWRISKDVPSEIVAAVQPAPLLPARPAPRFVDTFASRGGEPVRVPLAPRAPDPIATIPFERVQGTYLVDFLDTSRSLSGVRATLADRLKATVEFEELPESLGLPRIGDEAEALLWWTLPPSNWAQRVTVPVVVEAR